ncbi:MAG: enoyl-CoA hydratase/isomerase family protein, partial [Bdellovibrionales bacterium]|nr:enoyl-CoA hydratase/isomerase family protein [Bdellovibrionales bacterium]
KSSQDRAFCAGGDVKSLYHSMLKSPDFAKEFFKHEYFLDHYIHQYKKPIICLAHGITMGGGIGIMNGCSHRVVTETTIMAMPEITIGLFPDVGGTYFLNKMPDRLGLFLGLTGARINSNDALFCQLADFLIPSQELSPLEDKILNTQWTENNKENYNIIHRLISEVHTPKLVSETIITLSEEIKKLTSFDSFESLFENWKTYKSNNKWINSALENFFKGSPTSAKIIFKQITEGKKLSLDEVFQRELHMAHTFSDSADFKEGVRALLIDKDNSPQWAPLAQNINHYFN